MGHHMLLVEVELDHGIIDESSFSEQRNFQIFLQFFAENQGNNILYKVKEIEKNCSF